MRHFIIALGLASALCQAGRASAQEPAQTTPGTTDKTIPSPEPSFLTLDRVGTRSRWGVQLHTNAGYDRAPGVYGLRVDVFGRYVARNGLGAYAQMSAAHMDESLVEYGDTSGLNNTELGALYALRRGSLDLLLRAGAVLPSATWDDSYGSALTSPARIIDSSTIALDGWWTRLSVSPRIDRGSWFMQIDMGIDHPHGRDHLNNSGATSPLIHVDAAVGVRSHALVFTAENATYLLYNNDIVTARLDGSLAATVRYLGMSEVELYIGIVRPYDFELRGPALVVTTGIEGTLP